MWQIINDFVGNIIVAIGIFLFSKITLNTTIKISKQRLFLDFLLSIISYTVIMFYFEGTVKTFLMGITMVLFNKDIFKENLQKHIFITFLYLIMLIIPELIGLAFLIKILNMSKEFCYNEFAGSIICNALIHGIFLLMTYSLKNILRKLVNAKIETNTKVIIYTVLIFICIGMFFYNLIRKFQLSNDIILYLIVIIVLIMVLFSLIKQMIINSRLTKEYDNLLKFMITYENEIEKQRILRHEIKNEIKTIRAKIYDKQNNKEIIEYIDEIVNDKYRVIQEKYAKFGYLPPNGIKGLCYYKIQEAENKGIKVSVNISKRVKKSTIYELNVKQQRDFGRILGVLLDNAIEASINSDDKKLGIEAYTNSNSEFKLIITNTYNTPIDQAKIGVERFSTKGKNRGYGLLLAKQLVQNNKLFESTTVIKENLYIQSIYVKKETNIKN